MYMCLILSLYSLQCMRVACVQLTHSSLCDREDVSVIHTIIIIKSEVSTFPIVVVLFRGCLFEVAVLSYSVRCFI